MTKAKENATTTAQAMKDDGTVNVLDAKGRRIFVKQLNALDYYNVSKALGAVAASNPATLDMAMIACTVRKIDTTPYPLPTSERDIQFLIQTLDFDGLAAVGEAMKLLSADDKLAKDKEDAKNSAGGQTSP
jgi:hypothetical protein